MDDVVRQVDSQMSKRSNGYLNDRGQQISFYGNNLKTEGMDASYGHTPGISVPSTAENVGRHRRM
jgi:hypothetical protein